MFQINCFSSEFLNEFSSDGCTNSPNGNWGHCCYEHDFLYWAGGSYREKKYADERLLWCMNLSGGPGYLYKDFVRNAGLTFWSTAWKNQNRKLKVNLKEKSLIESEQKLWNSLGRPNNFEFINLESIIFPNLTSDQKKIIKMKLTQLRTTDSYKNFYYIYKQKTKYLPATEKFLNPN